MRIISAWVCVYVAACLISPDLNGSEVDQEFLDAVKAGNVEYVKTHAKEPLLFSGTGDNHPLVIAIRHKHNDVLQVLLKYANSFDKEVRTSFGSNLLQVALAQKNETAIPLLIEAGVTSFAADSQGITPLRLAKLHGLDRAALLMIAAVPEGRLDLVKRFEEVMFDVSRRDARNSDEVRADQDEYMRWLGKLAGKRAVLGSGSMP